MENPHWSIFLLHLCRRFNIKSVGLPISQCKYSCCLNSPIENNLVEAEILEQHVCLKLSSMCKVTYILNLLDTMKSMVSAGKEFEICCVKSADIFGGCRCII